jgi:hypothetical protein
MFSSSMQPKAKSSSEAIQARPLFCKGFAVHYRSATNLLPAESVSHTLIVPTAMLLVCVHAGVAIASGLHWYLKYYCNASIAWGKGGSGNQLATVPSPQGLPMPAAQRNVSPVRVRYAYNVSRQQVRTVAAG